MNSNTQPEYKTNEDIDENYEMEGVELPTEENIIQNSNENTENDNHDGDVIKTDSNPCYNISDYTDPNQYQYQQQQQQQQKEYNFNKDVLEKENNTYPNQHKQYIPKSIAFPSKNSTMPKTMTKNPSKNVRHNDPNTKGAIDYAQSNIGNPATISPSYQKLLCDHKKLMKENANIMTSLQNEIIVNEQQKSYISLLKKTMDEMIIKTGQTAKIEGIKKTHGKEKENTSCVDLMLEIPKLQQQLIDSNLMKKQLEELIAELKEKEYKLLQEKESQTITNDNLYQENQELSNDLNEVQKTYSNLQNNNDILINEINALKEEVEKYQIVTKEKEAIMQELIKEKEINRAKQEKMKQLNDDIQRQHELYKEIEKEIVVYTLNEESLSFNMGKVQEENKVLKKENEELKEKNIEDDKIIQGLKEVIDELNQLKASNLLEHSTIVNNKEMMINEQNAINHKLKEDYSKLEIDFNNNLILLSNLKEKVSVLTKDNDEMKITITSLTTKLKSQEEDNIKTSTQLSQLTQEYHQLQTDYHTNIISLQSQNLTITQKEKESLEKHMEEILNKDKTIISLQSKIDNPPMIPNIKYYNPRLALQSCLIATNNLLNNAHGFYSERDFQTFFESLDDLRRELVTCFDSLSNDNESRALAIKVEMAQKELTSYKNDNKKLYDHCKDLKEEICIRKEYNDVYSDMIRMVIEKHVNGKEIKECLKEIIDNSLGMIEMTFDMKSIEQKEMILYRKYGEILNQRNTMMIYEKGLGLGEQNALGEYDELQWRKNQLNVDMEKAFKRKNEIMMILRNKNKEELTHQ